MRTVVILLAGAFLALSFSNAGAEERGREIFREHCEACHYLQPREKLGPGLLTIKERTDRDWVKRFILNPQKVWEENKGYTKELKKRLEKENEEKTVMRHRLKVSPMDAEYIVRYLWSR